MNNTTSRGPHAAHFLTGGGDEFKALLRFLGGTRCPTYIKRQPEPEDALNDTVHIRIGRRGQWLAPAARLHFSPRTASNALKSKVWKREFITLHGGREFQGHLSVGEASPKRSLWTREGGACGLAAIVEPDRPRPRPSREILHLPP